MKVTAGSGICPSVPGTGCFMTGKAFEIWCSLWLMPVHPLNSVLWKHIVSITFTVAGCLAAVLMCSCWCLGNWSHFHSNQFWMEPLQLFVSHGNVWGTKEERRNNESPNDALQCFPWEEQPEHRAMSISFLKCWMFSFKEDCGALIWKCQHCSSSWLKRRVPSGVIEM